MGSGEKAAVAGLANNGHHLLICSVDASEEFDGRQATAIEVDNK